MSPPPGAVAGSPGAASSAYAYDVENRLVEARYDGPQGLTTRASYRYDALGRRIESVQYDAAGTPTGTTHYYYDGQNVIVEYTYDGSRPLESQEMTARTYVNGTQYIDERVLMRDFADRAEYPKQREHYTMLQELYTVAGLVSANGTLEEAYVYDGYGQATLYQWPRGDMNLDGQVTYAVDRAFVESVKTASGTATHYPYADLDMDGDVDDDDVAAVFDHGTSALVVGSSPRGNPYLFTGRPTHTLASFTHAGHTEFKRIQDNRNRTYDPKHGRWLQRDPLGTLPAREGGSVETTNLYADGMSLFQYVKNRPSVGMDPTGLEYWETTHPDGETLERILGFQVTREQCCQCVTRADRAYDFNSLMGGLYKNCLDRLTNGSPTTVQVTRGAIEACVEGRLAEMQITTTVAGTCDAEGNITVYPSTGPCGWLDEKATLAHEKQHQADVEYLRRRYPDQWLASYQTGNYSAWTEERAYARSASFYLAFRDACRRFGIHPHMERVYCNN